ncbi:hypothetical protein EBT31_07740 [bacterium]|nr:hypothetical protein [bacterium]
MNFRNISREQWIGGVVAIALIGALALGAYAWVNRDPYKGLVTRIEVQSDEGVRALAEQRIATAQASIQATEDAGEDVDENLYASIANDALLLGDLILARELLEKAIEENSLNSGFWSSYGYTLRLMQDWEDAKNAYLRAVELTPMEQTYRDAINILNEQFPEEKEKIKELYEDSIETVGRKMFNMLGLGRWYGEAGDCTKAKDHFEVAETISETGEIRQQVEDEKREVLSACRTASGARDNAEGRELKNPTE